MTSESLVPPTVGADSQWRQVESLVEEIAALAASGAPREVFHAQLLSGAVQAVGAIGGAVWTRTPQGLLHLERQANLGKTRLPESRNDQIRHAWLLDETLRMGAPRTAAPHSGSVAADEGANPTEFWLALCPVLVDGAAAALLETFHPAETSPDELRENLQLLAEIAALAADFYRGEQVRQLRQEQQTWQRLSRFLEAAYGHLDLRATAYAVANEGRAVLGCDRLSVAVVRDGRCRLEAVSGVEQFDRRASEVRRLEQLAQAAATADLSIQVGWQETDDPLPPQVEGVVQAHLDESPCRALAVLPLRRNRLAEAEAAPDSDSGTLLGVLLIEHFQGRLDEAARQRSELLVAHAAAALATAHQFEQIPLARTLQRWGGGPWTSRLRRVPWAAWGLAMAAALFAALLAVPADFAVEASGELQPQIRRHVFAPSDGVVIDLPARHDAAVRRGEVLAVLHDAELDYETRRLEGEMLTAQKRLAAIDALRLDSGGGRATTETPRRWTAEKEEIQELLSGLARQRDVLDRRREELTLRSPLDGRIVTWDIERRLQARPVTRGQLLLTVADLNGPWVLELEAPDRQMGHLEAARAEGQTLEVSFLRETDPTTVHRGRLERVALTTNADAEDRNVVQLIVALPNGAPDQPRPGAVVQARVHCGRRPLGYVWFHEVWEALQRTIWF